MRPFNVLLVALALVQGTDQVFEVGLCPGEGRPTLVAGVTELAPRERPSRLAPVTERLRMRKGERVEFGQTVYRTMRPGRLRALAQAQIRGRRLGAIAQLSREDYYSGKFPTVVLAVSTGEVVEYLQYRAEGTCFVRVRGDVIDADPCPAQGAESFVVEAKPEVEWWIQMLVSRRPKGWLLVDGTNVKEVGRTF